MDNTAKVEGKNLVIRIPIDNIKSGAEGYPNFFAVKVRNKRNLAAAIAEKIIDFGEDESGIPALFRIFDDIVGEIVEEGNGCIKVKFSPDDDWE